MHKRMWMFGIFAVLTVICCSSAYADAATGTTAWNGFWTSVGNFLHNALPWNWGSWMGK